MFVGGKTERKTDVTGETRETTGLRSRLDEKAWI